MAQRISVRRADNSDTGGLWNLIRQFDDKKRILTSREMVGRVIEDPAHLVLLAETPKMHEFRGFLLSEILPVKKFSFLNFIYVPRAYRGRGVGKVLMRHYEDYLSREGYEDYQLLVRKDNGVMNALVEEFGMVNLGLYFFYEKKLSP